MSRDKFIPRKFKNIETSDILNFEELVEKSTISIILGEPASGKTYQLKEYRKNNSNNSFLLKARHIRNSRNNREEIVLLFDSIDEALTSYPNIKDDLLNYIEDNKNKKFIFTCRYLEWKEYFETELKEVHENLQIYNILPLELEEINKLLVKEEIELFWEFINNNYLASLLKNILIVKHLIDNFKNYDKKVNYIDIYRDISIKYLTKVGEAREEQDKNISIDKQLLISSSLATYLTLNKEKKIEATKEYSNDLYKINDKDIILSELESILKTAIFEKVDKNFKFFHKSIQEYLTAYFLYDKKIDSKNIKEIFSHDLRFYEEFEEVIIYITNMQPNFFDDFIEFDPFIFRRHPSLTKEQQIKLLNSIINKLQKNESFAWDRVNFFYNTSLIKFNDINVYSIIKDKNLENTKSDILLQYIMRLFSENYFKEFEEYIFEVFHQNINNKSYCSKLINYSYNQEYSYNQRLFEFMEKNELFFVEKINESMVFNLYSSFNSNSSILNSLFFQLAKEKYDISKTLKLLKYIENKDFIIQLNLISNEKSHSIDDLKEWFDYLYDFDLDKRDRNFQENIKYIVYLLIIHYPNLNTILDKLIFYCDKHRISYQYRKNDIFRESYISSLPTFYSISDDFFNIYFSDKIHNFSNVENFLSIYHIRKIDIQKMQKEYPFEKNLIKTFKLLEYLNKREENEEERFLALEKEQLGNIVDKLEDLKYNEELIELIFTLFKFNYSERLEALVFQILEKNIKDIKVCRKYIEKTLITNYNYNLNLFSFMKKYNLFINDKSNEIEIWLLHGLYGLWFQNDKPILNRNKYNQKDIALLFEYISYYDFFHISKYINIKDIEKWFNYFYENYNRELLDNSSDYQDSLGWIAYQLLTNNNLEEIPLEKIMIFFHNTKISINMLPSPRGKLEYLKDPNLQKLELNIVQDKFWNIYFSDKIENFDKIEKIISLLNISDDDLKEAIKKYPIEEHIEKYYGLAIEYSFIDILMDNKEYQQHIEVRKAIKNLESSEQNYLNKIIQREKDEKYLTNIENYKDEYIFDIFRYAFTQKKDFKDADTKLKKDLGNNYENFIKKVSKSYAFLEKKYYDDCSSDNQWIYNYLFNILGTKEELTKVLISDNNYKKLFWYIILGCISTDNQELFRVIEDKFELFMDTVKEFIEVIKKKENSNCFDSSMIVGRLNINSPCRKIIDIFNKIEFDKKSEIWINFIQYIEAIKEETPQYKKFFELILEMNVIPITTPFSHFYTLVDKDINEALEYFYTFIYDPIPYKIHYSTEKKGNYLILRNDLYNEYFTDWKLSLVRNNTSFDFYNWRDRRTEEEKKNNEEKELIQALRKFYKEKECSYNVIKIILFEKLLFSIQEDYKKIKEIDEIYIKKILIDYYKLFKEEKIPLAKDYNSNVNYSYFRDDNSITHNMIIKLWGILQKCEKGEKCEKLLKELKKSKNNFISDSAEYCLLKNYDKQKDISSEKKDYKEFFDTYQCTKDSDTDNKTLIITEGKTDWKHLKKALERFQDKGEYLDLNIEFDEYENRGSGEAYLKKQLDAYSSQSNKQRIIGIFDRDTSKYVKDYGEKLFVKIIDKDYENRLKKKVETVYSDKSSPKYISFEKNLEDGKYDKIDEELNKILTGKDFEEWKKLSRNNVYAFCIPEIEDSDSPRTLNDICIEFYYKEKDLKTVTKDEKRLFFADEFEFNKDNNNNDNSKRFISKFGKYKTDSKKVKEGARAELTLISAPVFKIDDEQCEKNILLSKNDFTNNIINEIEGFDDFKIDNFKLIFDVIEKIVND